jgi:phage portal protein BeeE
VRLLDRLGPSRRYWEGVASGAAILTTSYGAPGQEPVLSPQVQTAMQAYGSNSVVFGAILARISLFSEATFAFKDVNDGHLHGANELDGRRANALRKLELPWPNGTTGELLARMIQDVDMAGNAYVWDAGTQLVRLRPDWVTIISRLEVDPLGRTYRKVVGYFYDPPPTVTDQDPQLFSVDEVAHWSPIPDPCATFRGMSWITPVMREINADQAMTDYKSRYLQNAASPNLLIKYAARLGEGAADRIAARVQAAHAGSENAFGTLVLDEGADATVIGNSLEQMSFATVQAAGENRILIASGVPGIVIGSKEGLMAATYSNYEQAMRRFADITMRPLWRSVCACLAQIITVPAGSRLWFDTCDIAALRQGEKERADTLLVQAQAARELVTAGFTRESITSTLESGDLSALVAGPAATPAAPAELGAAPSTPPALPALQGGTP